MNLGENISVKIHPRVSLDTSVRLYLNKGYLANTYITQNYIDIHEIFYDNLSIIHSICYDIMDIANPYENIHIELKNLL